MQNDTLRRATGLIARTRRRIAWKRVVSFLACIVVFCTTYALILPALTMEDTAFCGIESHQHSPECYEKVLICGQDESGTTGHTHTEDCVTVEQRLICENEDSTHRHTDECYETIETYTCGLEEGKITGHVHTDECYDSILICENTEHIHELICYSNPSINLESPSVWMSSLSGVELSGNNHIDLIEVAKSQLGYAESSLNYDVAEDGSTKKGYTRYGAWYGDPYGDWSGMFVSFCLNFANIPVECFPQEADCSVWVDKVQSDEYGFYVAAADGYKPLAGDLIFFDEDGDGSSDHVGLVAEMLTDRKGEFTKIKTIEGDVDNRVKYVTYPIKDETILGYAPLPNINSEVNGDMLSQTFNGEDYSITVTYGAEAQIPANAELNAIEYDTASEHYQLRYAEAAELYGWDVVQTEGIRLFNIGFYVDEQEIEPAAEVSVTITYANQEQAENYDVIHFAEEPEIVNAESFFTDGEQSIDFTLGHLSDIMAIAAEENTESPPPGIVEGISPNGTVINLFDYWIEDDVVGEDGTITQEGRFIADSHGNNKPNNGINRGHVLKFTDGGGHGETNDWTGSASPRDGLVEKTLGTDGYPRLTTYAAEHSYWTNNGTNNYHDHNGQPESLAYLFDPTIPDSEVQFRKTFRNVGGLLKNKEGYYYYNSKDNFAELNEETKQFTLYDTYGVIGHTGDGKLDGQFFPFNKFSEVQELVSTHSKMNHYMGLTMTSRFVQRYDGYTNALRNIATTFEFSGDDDVWIFIDGVLVGDLGGIHDPASISINFATGEVIINGNETDKVTLKGLFTAALGAEKIKDEDWNGNTFADNTFHTLKFFYMERGNWASDLTLTFNLTAVPATDIHKVDQYGRRIPGVKFAFYKADKDGNLLDQEPAYTGTTDDKGVMTFVDEDGMPYTIRELHEMFGDYCVVKETFVPKGYRKVSEDTLLRITDRVLWCENTYESGVWAMVELNVSAPMHLKLPARVGDEVQDYYTFGADGSTNIHGTLFGVVAKRVVFGEDTLDKLTSWAPVSGNTKDGYHVHTLDGQADKEAYFEQEAIKIAQEKGTVFKMAGSGAMELEMDNLPGHVYDYLYMIDKDRQEADAKFTVVYYWTTAASIDGANHDNTYRVTSDAEAPYAFDRTFGALIEVPNLGNRLIVQKYDPEQSKELNGPQKLINKAIFGLFPANMDGTFKAKNAAGEDCPVARNTIENGIYGQDYSFDYYFDSKNDAGSHAYINVDGKTIEALEVRRTSSEFLEGSDGTTAFGIREKPLEAGCYYLLELEAPPGYERNPTPVMVRVTDSAIYANAGIAPVYDENGNLVKDDYIRTARGVGYIVSTLHKAASAGDINRTLTWIYHRLCVSSESTSFEDAIPNITSDPTPTPTPTSDPGTPTPTPTVEWRYLRDKDGNVLTSYLVYDRTPQSLGWQRFLANYEPDEFEEIEGEPPRVEYPETVATHTLPIATEYGWSFNEIYQDTQYGLQWLSDMKSSANYTELGYRDPDTKAWIPSNLYNLFSRAIYVRVGNKRLYSDLEISKQVVGEGDLNGDFTFTVTVEDLPENAKYVFYIVDSDGTKTTLPDFAGSATITLKHNQVAVIKNLPGGLNYTVTETPFSGYKTAYKIDNEESVEGFKADGILHCRIKDGDRYVSKVAFTNTIPNTTTVTVIKKPMANDVSNLAGLDGAKFVLCTTLGDSTYYYSGENQKWVKLEAGQTESSFALTTGENAPMGEINFKGIPNGTYVLKEVAAPDGFMRLKADIIITIDEGQIKSVTVGEDENSEYIALSGVQNEDGTTTITTITVKNVAGHELPATGGTGIKRYITGGTLLCACAGIVLLYIKRKRRKEDSVSP